ncbi:MAG: beta-ketoacyl-ACP synthase II [SAR86 cluster bacterium]|nr:beta-ketoacyl-ACP synthase II [SAR86 cluster bacterium]HIC27686.1 beta-ketoacyl-[acyl-carrier-protein] synthase II [Gammaproteobacteria bacterium]
MSKRRVVITGLGLLSPVGNEVEDSWENLLSGMNPVKPIKYFDVTDYKTNFAASLPSFNAEKYLDKKEIRRLDPFIQYGVVAAKKCILDSGIEDNPINLERIGVSIGSGIGGLGTIEYNANILAKSGTRKISPFFVPGSIINMASGYVSIKFGFKGPNISIASACSSASHSIGYSFRSIAYGDADLMLTGGAEMGITPLSVAGFIASKALSTRNESPQTASRPWDKDRDGFVIGEGAGCLMLEELEHAKSRRAKIYAEIIGFGMSADAFHMTSPPESAEGATSAMKNALNDAEVNPSDIEYINAHGTSTQIGDLTETSAIKKVFGEDTSNYIVSSTKSMTGHLLGAAGAIEAIYCILAIRDNVVPPTINLSNPGEGCDLNYSPNNASEITVSKSISNSFGFGGTNATLVFSELK